MKIQKIIDNLTSKEKKIVSILFGWTILHLILLLISDGSKDYFWPFDTEPSIKSDYDFSEFLVYGLVPWVMFFINKFLNKKSPE